MGNVKPYFFYANGTSFFFGIGALRIGSLPGSQGTIKGYNGRTQYWDGQEWNDPFWKLLDPDKWNAVRIDYPASILPGALSIATGVTNTLAAITALPAGTPYALGGYSQGAAVMTQVFRTLRTSTVYKSRLPDLKAAVMFGNPCRQTNAIWGPFKSYSGGRSTAAFDAPTGAHGCFAAPMRMTDTPPWWFEFAGSNERPIDIVNCISDSPACTTYTNLINLALNFPAIGYLGLFLTSSAIFGFPNNGHGDYATKPPPGYGANDPTSYQIALEYLDMIADSVYTIPKYVAPPTVTVTTPVSTTPIGVSSTTSTLIRTGAAGVPTTTTTTTTNTTTTVAPVPQPAIAAADRIYTFNGSPPLNVTLDGKTALSAQGQGQLATNLSALVDYNQTGLGTTIARTVLNYKPALEWMPVVYGNGSFPLNVSVQAAVDKTVSMILNKPGKVWLSGTGIGAYVTSQLYREFTLPSGRLYSRRGDLMRVYHFGNPLRQVNMYRASDNPGGHGMAGPEFRLTNTDPNIVWEFANPGDPVTTQLDDQRGAWAKSFFGIINQNVSSLSELNYQLTQLLFAPNSYLPTLMSFVQELGDNLLNQRGRHSGYETFYPIAGLSKSAVQLAIDDMMGISNPVTSSTTTTTTTTTPPSAAVSSSTSTTGSTSKWSIAVPNAIALSGSDLTTVMNGIRALKIDKVRIPVSWPVVQTSSTTFNWVAADAAINAALTAGLQPMMVLAPPRPTWCNAATSDTNFGTFAAAAATRYRPGGTGITIANAGKGVLEYQIWDEPNVSENPTTGVNASSAVDSTARSSLAIGYVAYLKAAYTAIKQAQPTAIVVFGGLQACTTFKTPAAGTPVTYQNVDPVTFLTDCYTAGVRGAFDVMAYHPMSMTTRQNPKPPAPSGKLIEQSDNLRAVMTNVGDNKPMYWTAVGYDTNIFTDLQQQYYLETLRWFANERSYVTNMCIYGYRDY